MNIRNIQTSIFQLSRLTISNYKNVLPVRYCLPNFFNQSVRFKSLEEKVGLPPRPRRPLTPYFRFLKEIRPTIVKQNPNASVTEISKLVAEHWEKVDPKKKEELETACKKEQEEYAMRKLSYESQLTTEDRQKLTRARQEQELNKEKREKRKKCKEFQRPKKSPSAFVLWMKDQYQTRGSEPFREFQLKLAEKWKNMSEIEKQPFVNKAKELNEKYREEIALWEEKMIRLGNIDIIRGESLMEPKPKKASAVRKSRKVE